jgi:hypothetical protein
VSKDEKKQKCKSAYCALYITASVVNVLDVVTIVLHVHNPTVGCLYTTTMVAIPLFSFVDILVVPAYTSIMSLL